MKRKEITLLIEYIHNLIAREHWQSIGLLLTNVSHQNKEYSLSLLRSSFCCKENYLDMWRLQREYAKGLFGDESEVVLKGLL